MNQSTVREKTIQIQPTRLSQSPLWQAQRNYFIEQGIEAWRQNIVPSYVTTNPFIAHAYAELVLAYLEDYQVENTREVNTEQPFYILDLGAGSGKFAFHFLRHFLPEYSERFPDGGKVCYVMADISKANIEFWQSNEQLQPFVAQGVLDFAQFDVCAEQSLRLRVSGRVLSSQTQQKPMAAIANYLFDSIPHDVFELKQGELFECLVTLHQRGKAVADGDEVKVESLDLKYHHQPCAEDCYPAAEWNQILRFYRENIEDGVFLLPVGGLRCLENLHAISNEGDLLC